LGEAPQEKSIMEENKERQNVSAWFKDAWGQALAAVNSAEEEAQKVLQKAGGMVGWNPDEVLRQAREFGDRLGRQRKELERTVEERVKRALGRVKVPRREDLDKIRARIEKLSARIDALKERH
jgi:polyhydroxyalkanoate synthesis regulator phasin